MGLVLSVEPLEPRLQKGLHHHLRTIDYTMIPPTALACFLQLMIPSRRTHFLLVQCFPRRYPNAMKFSFRR